MWQTRVPTQNIVMCQVVTCEQKVISSCFISSKQDQLQSGVFVLVKVVTSFKFRESLEGFGDTNLHLQIFFIHFFTTSIQNWTDKSMKMDLIYRNKCWNVERGWTGMLCWFCRSGNRWGWSRWRLDRGWLVGRLKETEKNFTSKKGRHKHQGFSVLPARHLYVSYGSCYELSQLQFYLLKSNLICSFCKMQKGNIYTERWELVKQWKQTVRRPVEQFTTV